MAERRHVLERRYCTMTVTVAVALVLPDLPVTVTV